MSTIPANKIIPFQAFTARVNGRTLRLITPGEIFPAYAPSQVPAPQGKKYQVLYDTGATNSAISPRVVTDLNLPSIGARTVAVGGGSLTTTAHLVNIALPNKVMFAMVPVAKMVLLGGIDVLVGMDILGLGDFAVTHPGGKTVFSFCVPSRKDIDFVVEIQQSIATPAKPFVGTPAPGRNSRCPCGSGRKYKACHGQIA